jgi:hypothetical protein
VPTGIIVQRILLGILTPIALVLVATQIRHWLELRCHVSVRWRR